MKKVLYLLCVVFLTGCSKTYYNYNPPQSETGKSCIARCEDKRAECKQNRATSLAQCKIMQQALAQTSYDNYLREYNKSKAQKNPIPKRLSDFENIFLCSDIDNINCFSSYNDCFIGCGGRIETYEK